MKPLLLTEFEEMRDQNLMELTTARSAGRKVVGTYCLYTPAELIVAAGAIPVSLCGTRQAPISAAEKYLPRNLCPLIKSSFGSAVTDTCPYFYFTDLLVAETTCDGKKKMYEILGKIKPLHLMQLPQTQEGEDSFNYWYREVVRFKNRLEEELGTTITDSGLKSAVQLLNEERQALADLQDVCKHIPSPISGVDLLAVLHLRNFFIDKRKAILMLNRLTAELRDMSAAGSSPFRPGAPRILLTGVPVGTGSDKVIRIIEESGGSVVCLESCSAYKKVAPVDESLEPLTAIAKKYLLTPCSCMSPNNGRLELVARLAGEFAVDGIIDLTWQACHTYNLESFTLQQGLQKHHDLPFLQIETDYSEGDSEQLRVRIEAFLEML